MVKEKKDTNPVLLKFGVAVAISFGGIFYSFFRPRMMKRSLSPPPPGFGNQVDSEGMKSLVKDETFNNSENQTLLPEFEEIVKDFNMASPRAYITPDNDIETLDKYESEPEHTRTEEYEREISNLNNTIGFLQKRVSTLEKDLLKYYGLKEQESTITELQNRVKIHNTEAKLFNLKIEALQADNKKLKSKLVDYSKTVSELESAKETIELLKKKLKAETEYNKKQLLSLQERVKKMHDQEIKAVSGNTNIESKVQRIKELEGEADDLRIYNNNLQVENLELTQKLEQAQTTTLHKDHEVEALKEETNNLRQQNEELSKQVKQLQSSWCADIEELVYLRWINACLRYEVRNYQPEPGKTSSRDLSKTLSPKSEEKAKKLIMEYANKQGLVDKGRHIMDSDFDQWSCSQFSLSNHSDNGELFEDDSSLDRSSANKTDTSSKRRIFGKLRRLLRGEDEKNNNNSYHDNRSSSSEIGFNDFPLVGSERYLKGIKTEELKELERRRRYSDLGLPRISKSLVYDENSGSVEERSKLVKYAEVFNDSSKENSKVHRRAVSHS